ncbi:PREDICTED: uncharacterized protein LOC104715261 [Camelina sativa]|uniref:Uncharacterized protein LOC104715261 n=1 Tax=Camelina sativa TaxID=90675 RepID=A0ABM1QKI8_CAMSA|nr:PREDICTED: uncharacterized protein LOC104715261 [Camelina sativa]
MLTPQGTGLSFVDEFTQHIDVEDLYKRFHHPTGYVSDYFEEEVEGESNQSVRPSNYYVSQMAHAPQLQYQHFRSRQNTEPNGGAQDNFNQRDSMQYQPMMYQQEYQFMRPETNQYNQMGSSVPNLVQMGSVPNLVHTQAPMMPMTYQQEQQPIQNQALTMIVSDVVLYLQQYLSEQISKVLQDRQLGSFSVNQNYSNQQQTGLPEP